MGEMVAMNEMGRKERMGKVRHIIVYRAAYFIFAILSYVHFKGHFHKGSLKR